MLKRLSIVLVLTLAVFLGFAPYRQAVLSNVLTDAELAAIKDAALATPNGATLPKQDGEGGNGFVKVLAAPFKAIGRLFGHGKKDDNQPHRLSEKDAKKFETAKMTRVVDARTVPTAAAESTTPTIDPATGRPINPDTNTVETNKDSARKALQHGRELFSQNDINGAINFLSMAVSLDKELWDAHNLLGIAYEMKGLRAKALESLETAVKSDKPQPEHLNDFGYILIKNGEYSRAVKYLKRAVKVQPDNQRFLNNLGLALVQTGKLDDAYKAFNKAMGEFDGRMNMATQLLRLGYDKEAIKHLEICRAMQPNSLDVVYRLSVLYARNGQTTEADEANKAFLSLKAAAMATEKK